ncbi:MAG: hypothetical protein HQL22_12870 [Candidatus Omnitrophica bacterium]|nr:hypothetical protein [Candidatus Omnitrophota bacterium]
MNAASSTILNKPQELNGTFWGITTFFNPSGYKNKIENYRLFRASSRRQGLSLVTVELAFDDVPFSLNKDEADILIQLRTSSKNVLWQKEAMLNVALKRLPDDCDKVAWLDCDILFKNDAWVTETSSRLEKYVVVQPFSFVVCLPFGIRSDADLQCFQIESDIDEKSYGVAYGVARFTQTVLGKLSSHGHVGFAWAARRSVLDKHGFLDQMILGVSDALMAYAFYNYRNSFSEENYITDFARQAYTAWLERVYPDVQGSVGCADGVIFHLWHGDFGKRFYAERHFIELLHGFDPAKDIRKDVQGIWVWSSEKPGLHQAVRDYFNKRREEDARPFIHTILLEPRFRRIYDLLQHERAYIQYRRAQIAYFVQKVLKAIKVL